MRLADKKRGIAAHIAVMASVKAPHAGSRRLMHTCGVTALPNLGRLLGRSCILHTQVVPARRPSRQSGHGVIEAQTAVPLKATTEGGSQSYSMSLRTADPLTATGLVHRSLVTEAQNSRRVSVNPRCINTHLKKDMQNSRWLVRHLGAQGNCMTTILPTCAGDSQYTDKV